MTFPGLRALADALTRHRSTRRTVEHERGLHDGRRAYTSRQGIAPVPGTAYGIGWMQGYIGACDEKRRMIREGIVAAERWANRGEAA